MMKKAEKIESLKAGGWTCDAEHWWWPPERIGYGYRLSGAFKEEQKRRKKMEADQ